MIKIYTTFEDFANAQMCNAWVAAAVIGSAAIGAAVTSYSANKAASAQTKAAAQAAGTALNMYHETKGEMAPFKAIGVKATDEMSKRLADLTAPISVDPDALQYSDYFKFAMTQGQKAVTNSAAARGLGTSGAALKGAAAFAKGLATDTYKTAWEMENTNKKNAYDRLKGLIDTGVGAVSMTGQLGEKAAYNAGQAQIGAGNAQAASANATGAAISGATKDIGGYYAYKGLYGAPQTVGSGSLPGEPGSPYYGPAW